MEFTKHKFMSIPNGVHARERSGISLPLMKQMLFGRRIAESQSLYKRDLRGHFGCVNAIEFSTDGEFIASGGDDRRLLLWNMSQTIFDDKAPLVIDTLHISNINSCCFDADNRKVSTGGNDGQVIVHDFNVRQSTAVYGLSDAVYCLSPDPINSTIIATATDDGKAQILDLRMSIDTSPFVLADLSTAMHSIMFNPAEPRLLATANSKHGVGLWDIRMPLKCLHYKSNVQNCMSVRFNSRGDQLLALRRRSSPVLYDISKMHPIYEFDYDTYYNACTLKSCSFAGQKDEYVMSGSDDFCIYLWKIPTDISENYIQSEPHMILKGHRSIVNQVRYCPYNQAIISSGVEKLIKLWSPYYIPGCTGRLVHSRRYGDDDEVERNAYSHEEYIHMVLQAGSFLSHDYTNGSTEEEPCMIAFFDSLIQREIEQSIEGGDDDEDGREISDDTSSNVDDESDDGGGGDRSSQVKGLSNGQSSQGDARNVCPPTNESEDASNTRDTTVSTSSRLEDSSRPFYVDLESSSDSEGEVDVILSAMYSRYMSARERAMNSSFRPSGKKISSVIAKGKQKDSTLQKKIRSRKPQRIHKNATSMSILADVIDNFVDNLVARGSSNSQTLSDTNDGHLSTDSSSNNVRENNSTPVEVIQQTVTLHADGTAGIAASPTSQSLPSVAADNILNAPVIPITLESGMYFMPELQAFAPESFNMVTNLTQAPGPSRVDNRNRATSLSIQNTSQSDQQSCLRSRSSLEVVPSGSSEIINSCAMNETLSIINGGGGSSNCRSRSNSVETSDYVTTCRTLVQKGTVAANNHSNLGATCSVTDKNRSEIKKHFISVPSTMKDDCLVKPDPVFKRTSSKCNNLSSTSPSLSISSGGSSHYLASASSSAEALTGVDSEVNGFRHESRSSQTATDVDSNKTMSVHFKKVKVKGKRFRVHRSEMSSSSDEEI